MSSLAAKVTVQVLARQRSNAGGIENGGPSKADHVTSQHDWGSLSMLENIVTEPDDTGNFVTERLPTS